MKTSLNILYEDNHIIAVNKFNNDLTHKDITRDLSLEEKIKHYIKNKYNKPGKVFLGTVHRLDRPVSGAVIFARTSKALSRLNKMLRENEISKKYWAIVKNKPPKKQDTIVNYLIKNQKQNKSYTYEKPVLKSKEAILEYQMITKSNNHYLLEINLITGRHHQIRTQLANINCPVKGDLKYGFSKANEDGSIHLHSREISFIHPVKKNLIKIIADPPKENILWRSFLNMIT